MADLDTPGEGQEADIVIILSSELIATVIEAHFNTVLLKIPVRVVDLKPTPAGYAFSLAFVAAQAEKQMTDDTLTPETVEICQYGKLATMCWQCEELESREFRDRVHQDAVKEALASAKKPKRARNGQFSTKDGQLVSESQQKGAEHGRDTWFTEHNTPHNTGASGTEGTTDHSSGVNRPIR